MRSQLPVSNPATSTVGSVQTTQRSCSDFYFLHVPPPSLRLFSWHFLYPSSIFFFLISLPLSVILLFWIVQIYNPFFCLFYLQAFLWLHSQYMLFRSLAHNSCAFLVTEWLVCLQYKWIFWPSYMPDFEVLKSSKHIDWLILSSWLILNI